MKPNHNTNSYRHTFDDSASEGVSLHGKTVWRPMPAYPFFTTKGLPFWKRPFEKFWRPQCGCGLIFKSMDDFKAHYIYMAVWQDESDYIPGQLAQAQKLVNKLAQDAQDLAKLPVTVREPGVMTGQEWYDKFLAELKTYDWNPDEANSILVAAKKAAGIQ